ncbi:hypothetical protein BDR06DRAFT_983479 [Suillus hirtellus]|nr:hypothetical protein BDR06DRAFT_983479 [Suillus hirtellus]
MDSMLHERWQKQFGVQNENEEEEQSAFHLFESCLDWEVACWAIEKGIGHGALDRLLAIPGVQEKLGLSYHNTRALHKSLDTIPPRAEWHSKKLAFEDCPNDEYNIYYRNSIDAIQLLLGNPVHTKDIVYYPKKIFRDHTKSNHLPVGAALAPVIIAMDKTQLTQFSSSKSAYPIYLTLGNIPRAICRKPSQQACFLLGYLLVDKILKDNLSSCEMSSRAQRLFHDSLHIILEPLKLVGAEGVEITGRDGCIYLTFPVLACYIADYHEQCLVTCSNIIEEVKLSTNTSFAFKTKCMEAGVKGEVFLLFWHCFPHYDIHHSITPDISLSPCYGLHHFKNKWSFLAHILLGCMIGKVPRDVIISYRSLLNFIYLTQYSSYDDETLAYMEKALKDFHHHRNILFNLGVREHLDISKIHSLLHYVDSITWFGTMDNYNIEMIECFHIDFCKEGLYASNHCNAMPQMISWLSRREKTSSFKAYLQMTLENEEEEITYSRFKDQNILIAKYPARKNQDIQEIMEKHACPGFQCNLTYFINSFNNNIAREGLRNASLPFSSLDVYHGFRFSLNDLGNEIASRLNPRAQEAQPDLIPL